MADPEVPQIYLITPPEFDLVTFPETLARCLDQTDVACLRLSVAIDDPDRISRAADAIRPVAHDRDIAVVLETHIPLAESLGLDGVHLPHATLSVRDARKALGPDAIIGSFCGATRHDGMAAGEAGADYVAFGPVSGGLLGTGDVAEDDLFTWWSQMIELPVVAEGGLDDASLRRLAPMVDFFAFGQEIWTAEDPLLQLSNLVALTR